MLLVDTKSCMRCDTQAYWLRIETEDCSSFCQFHGPMEANFGRRDEEVIWRLV